ncbi:MAG: ATP-binding cassette domain-containing protein, partial [Eubacteriales bacterium]|nr:ATP-binding cassette domain-containing protein [Eubacteriales bacterium]
SMLEAQIEKRLGHFNLRVDLAAGNETLALLGASGAGKTMTLKCLAGLMKPDRGRIVVDGKVWFDSEKHIFVPPQARGVGLLFQNYALFPNMTVRQNLLCGLRRETPRREREAAAQRLIDRFHLTGLENHLPVQLSGGQQQRAALARCLARKPKLLLLDEPFTALDNHLRWQLEQELSVMLAGFDGTALYVTHDRDETRRLCQKVCVMHAGRTQDMTDVGQWYHSPDTRSAALLAGFENVTDVIVTQGTANIADWGLCFPCGETATVAAAFRAEDTRFAPNQEGFAIYCRIVRATEQETIAMPIDCPTCIIRAGANCTLQAGDIAWLCVDPQMIAWLRREE